MAEPERLMDPKPGDLCHNGSNRLPMYRVIFVHGDRVWLRDVSTGADAVVPVCECVQPDEEFLEVEDEPPPPAVEKAAASDEPPKPSSPTWPDGTPRP